MTNIVDQTTPDKRLGRKARAILALGLIAAVGVGGTLAAWNSGVFSSVNITGSDTAPPTNAGLLEVFDASGSWVSSSDSGDVHLISELTLPDVRLSPNRSLSNATIGKVRLTGVSDDASVLLTGQVSALADRLDVQNGLSGLLYLTADPCGKAGVEPAPRHQFTQGDAGSLVPFAQALPREHTVTGPFEMNICTTTILPGTVADFTENDSAELKFNLTARSVD